MPLKSSLYCLILVLLVQMGCTTESVQLPCTSSGLFADGATVEFVHDSQGRIIEVKNHIWERYKVGYFSDTLINIVKVGINTINGNDTTFYRYNYSAQRIDIEELKAIVEEDTVTERVILKLDVNGRILELIRNTYDNELVTRSVYTWTNGNVTHVDTFDSDNVYSEGMDLTYDGKPNPMKQFGNIFWSAVLTSTNNPLDVTYTTPGGPGDAFTGITLTYNGAGYPSTYVYHFPFPIYREQPTGTILYQDCK